MVGLLDHAVALFLLFKVTSLLFPIVFKCFLCFCACLFKLVGFLKCEKLTCDDI